MRGDHAPWCGHKHGPHGRCRRVIGHVGPLSVGLLAVPAGHSVIRLLDPATEAIIDINVADMHTLMEAIGLAQRHLGAGAGADLLGLPAIGDDFDQDPLVLATVRAIRQFCDFDVDRATATEAIELCISRDLLDDEQFEAVLGRFPVYEVAERCSS